MRLLALSRWSLCPCTTTRESLKGFSINFILESYADIYQHNVIFGKKKTDSNNVHGTWKLSELLRAKVTGRESP
jgi:hypothetical protein